ncbi:hypothetical protein N7513_012831 [Penicillium frequentans]|nr:hypothetical protein N7513_012831 [Penicillium glabrum]
MSPKRKNKEYYAILKGRVEEPTIFSSWGHAHPRITWYDGAVSRSFTTLKEARGYMKEEGVPKSIEIIRSEDENTTPEGGNGFYAVANGNNPGVYPFYRGKTGSEKEVKKVTGSCHKRFRTRAQAEAFIEDWNETCAEIWSKPINKEPDQGFRPRDTEASRPYKMMQTTGVFLQEPVALADIDELEKKTTKLSLQDETGE